MTYDLELEPKNKIEAQMYDALSTSVNSIAGRPNAGNPVLDFIQQHGKLPLSVLAHYELRCLRQFIPNVRFSGIASNHPHPSFQQVFIDYEVIGEGVKV